MPSLLCDLLSDDIFNGHYHENEKSRDKIANYFVELGFFPLFSTYILELQIISPFTLIIEVIHKQASNLREQVAK